MLGVLRLNNSNRGFTMNEQIKTQVKSLLIALKDHDLEQPLVEIVEVLTAPTIAGEAHLIEKWIPQAELLIQEAKSAPEPPDWSAHREGLSDE